MVYALAGLVAITIGFVLGRFSFNFVSDVWRYIFPPLKDEAPTDCSDFKNAGAAVGVIGAVAWCEIAILCGSPLWAVLGCFLGGLIGLVLCSIGALAVVLSLLCFRLLNAGVRSLGLLLSPLGALVVVLFLLCFVLLDAGVRSLGLLLSPLGGFVDKGYARAKHALSPG